jgi:hypothetical protein
MPRPSLEEDVRKAVREYPLLAENLSAEEAPLNTLAVAELLNFDRKTLKKYHLDEEIAAAAERQAVRAKPSPREIKQRSIQNMLSARDQEIAAMRQRCESLIARVCLAEGNAQRLWDWSGWAVEAAATSRSIVTTHRRAPAQDTSFDATATVISALRTNVDN